MRLITRTIAILLLLSSCQPSAKEDVQNSARLKAQQIYTEAIAVHDEVMLRMDEMMQLKQQLRASADSLQQLDSVTYAETIAQLNQGAADLEQADAAMMQWMRTMQPVPRNDQHQTEEESTDLADTANLIQVQETQKEAIAQVKQQMESSIRTARSLLYSSDH